MLRVNLIDRSQWSFCRYTPDTFVRQVLGTFDELTEPPFRDPESLMFIQQVDQGHLVEGDWYSYVSPYGRTCMSSLCGGTQYALTLIYRSRKGQYTSYEPYYEDIWQRLQSLSMDILVLYDPNSPESGLCVLPSELKGCIVENASIGGTVYKKAVYDADCGKNYMDDSGVFHFDGWLDDYKWIWGEHLKEIFEYFERQSEDKAVLPEMKPAVLKIPPEYSWFQWQREVLCCSDSFVLEGLDKYPQSLSLQKHRDGTITAAQGCPCKYPNFYEALNDAVKWWRDDCEAAFHVFIDTGSFYGMNDFRQKRLWYFEDDGKTVRAYSGIKGLRRLMEFVGDSWKDGTMRALEINFGQLK